MSSSDDPFFPNNYEQEDTNSLDLLSFISLVGMIFFVSYAVPQMIFSIIFKRPSESEILLQHNISHGIVLIISIVVICISKLKINFSIKLRGRYSLIGFAFCISFSLAVTVNQQCNENSPLTIIQFISIGVFAPICEELAFRGMLYSKLSKNCTHIASIFITSFLFALVHFRSDILTKLVILFLSALWNYVNCVTNSIFPSIVLHICHNTLHSLSNLKIGLCGFPKHISIIIWIFGTIFGFIFINSNEIYSENKSEGTF